MRKVIIFFIIIILSLICIPNDKINAQKYRQGNYVYSYKIIKEGAWIYKVTAKSDQNIGTIKFPKKLGGKRVVKLAGIDDYDDDGQTDIFGLEDDYEGKSKKD